MAGFIIAQPAFEARSLRRLVVWDYVDPPINDDEDWERIEWGIPAQALPSLEELWLAGGYIELGLHSHLPTTLTSLHLRGPWFLEEEGLPSQASAVHVVAGSALLHASPREAIACQ